MSIGTAGRRRHGLRDGGFTLSEVAVSLAIVATAMAALAPFLVDSVARVRYDGNRQAAVRLAGDAAELVRSRTGAALVAGRSPVASAAQWAAAPAPVRPYLDRLLPLWDPDPALPAGAGAAAALPTAPRLVTTNGIGYEQHWYVGRCRTQGGPGGADRTCERPDAPDPDAARRDVHMIAVVVAVTWPQRQCPGGACAYVTSTYVSGADDPVFPAGGA